MARITSSDLLKKNNSGVSQLVADDFFEAAAGPVTHATSGDLTGQGSSIAGTAAHIAIHATSGTLTGVA